jgi:hypothetical protein
MAYSIIKLGCKSRMYSIFIQPYSANCLSIISIETIVRARCSASVVILIIVGNHFYEFGPGGVPPTILMYYWEGAINTQIVVACHEPGKKGSLVPLTDLINIRAPCKLYVFHIAAVSIGLFPGSMHTFHKH